MDSSMSINSILVEVLTKLDYTLEPPGFEGDARTKQIMKNTLSKAIDAIGEQSATAQGLKRVITTAEKLQDSPTHLLYILKDPNGHYGQGEVIGLLKVGRKHLYLYDELDSVHEVEPLCVLDFFVKPERQRSGYGKFLFDYMLNDLKVDVNELAIDGPSAKMMLFLQRNYGLEQMMRQTNNFAVSPNFFANCSKNEGSNRLSRKELPQAAFGRNGARRPHSTVASVIHGENPHFESNPKLSPSADLVESDLTEELEQLTLTDGGGLDQQFKRLPSSRLRSPHDILNLAPMRPSTLQVVAEPVEPLPAGLPSNTTKLTEAPSSNHKTLAADLLLKDNTPAAGLPSSANKQLQGLPFNIKKLATNSTSNNITPGASVVSNGNNMPLGLLIDANKVSGELSSKDNTFNPNTPAAGLPSNVDKLATGIINKTDDSPSLSFVANTTASDLAYNEDAPAAGLSSNTDALNNQMTRTGFLDLKFFHNPLW